MPRRLNHCNSLDTLAVSLVSCYQMAAASRLQSRMTRLWSTAPCLLCCRRHRDHNRSPRASPCFSDAAFQPTYVPAPQQSSFARSYQCTGRKNVRGSACQLISHSNCRFHASTVVKLAPASFPGRVSRARPIPHTQLLLQTRAASNRSVVSVMSDINTETTCCVRPHLNSFF
jgi:hypothetical protein